MKVSAGRGAVPPESSERPGQRVSHYRVVRPLGQGGMGAVSLAWDETLERHVALKAIRADRRSSARVRARFLREARTLSSLDHRGICRIYDYVEGSEADYLVLEYVEGRTVREALRDGVPRALALELAEQLAGVLAVAHAAGVVHRDLKPENLMLTRDGELKVLDFGLARLTAAASAAGAADEGPPRRPGGGDAAAEAALAAAALPETVAGGFAAAAETADPDGHLPGAGGPGPESPGPESPGPPAFADPGAPAAPDGGSFFLRTELGAVVGSPLYMSPEQARGEEVTAASDLYAFGLILQELLTGSPAYGAERSVPALLERAAQARTEPVQGLAADLDRLLKRLLARAPTDRPTAVEAVERLRWIRGTPRRRARRAAAAALLAAVALGGLKYTLDLEAARDEAQQRRAQAEDLISFMLGDLREKLQPVGRLEILDDVGAKALQYFATLEATELSDDDLFRRSKALRQIGEVRVAQGDLGAAMVAFRESLTLAEDLAARDPQRGEWLAGLGASRFYVGSVLWAQGDVDGTLAEFEGYRDVAQRLVELDPANPEWQLEMGYALTNLGAVHDARGDLPAAVTVVERSNAIKRALVASAPERAEWLRSLANGLSWLGSLRERQGRLGAAREQFEAELQLRQTLVRREPDNSDALQLLSVCRGHLGRLLLALGRPQDARPHLEDADRLMRSLAHRDPLNRDWQRDVAVGLRQLAELRLAQPGVAERTAAAAELARAAAILEELVAADPSNADWREQLADTMLVRAQWGAGAEEPRESLLDAERARAVLDLPAEDEQASPRRRLLLARAHLLAGDALAALGQPDDAAGRFREGVATLEPLAAAAADPRVLAPLSLALFRLGRAPEAAATLSRLRDTGYAGPQLAELLRAAAERPQLAATPPTATDPVPER